MTVRVTDKGYNAALKRISAIGAKISVGVPETHDPHSGAGGMTVADIAAIHEFGSPKNGIPERSFIRAWADANEERIKKMILIMAQSIASGKRTRNQALEVLGLKWVAEVQQRIAANIPPALKPATIARKGSDVALIDTGQLRSAITYIIAHAKGQAPPPKAKPAAGRAKGKRRQ